MCGIAGVLIAPSAQSATVFNGIGDSRQHHRGPDDDGSYADPEGRARLSFRRLAIVDLTNAGHQPMSNEDGSVWLVFNGEIYNHLLLRRELEVHGHVFKSRTDSEVILHGYEQWGRNLLARLNGMFAFCIWDERRGEALLARDHAGIKPLYWTKTADGIAFASEAKVLLSVLPERPDVDATALQQYLTLLWVPGHRTMWQRISKLEPGQWLSFRDGKIELGTWWDWDQSQQEERSPEDWAREVRGALLRTVDRQLMSDVPLGALVSGGLDSSCIAAAMRELRPTESLRAYTARISDEDQDGFADDLPYAREVGERLGLDLIECDISPDIASLLSLLVWHSDEPLADPAIAASYLLCRRAREDGTVVLLSGQGADELYHGYRSHRALNVAARFSAIPPVALRAANAVAAAVAGKVGASAGAFPRRILKLLRSVSVSGAGRALELADWGSDDLRRSLLLPSAREATNSDVFGEYLELFERSRATTDEERWSYVLFKTFLPALNLTYGDKTSMASSVELRVPFLDRELVEQAGRIPLHIKHGGGRQKRVLLDAARNWLPDSVLNRPKTGFGAPLRSWLVGPLEKPVRNVLLGERFLSRGLFDVTGVRAALDDLKTGRRDVAYIIWALFTFEVWARTFIDADGDKPLDSRWISGGALG